MNTFAKRTENHAYQFNTSVRTDTNATLVSRVRQGVGLNHLKKVDYKELKSIVEEKRHEGVRSLAKMNLIQQRAKEGREENLLKQHRLVWQHEYQRLKEAEHSFTADLAAYVNEKLQDVTDEYDIESDELDDDYAALERNFNDFLKQTLEPVKDLIDDVNYWLQALRKGADQLPSPAKDVMAALESVRSQQSRLLEELTETQQQLERCHDSDDCQSVMRLNMNHGEPEIRTGIPDVAYDLECPDEEVKAALLQEFILLDSRYQQRLDELAAAHADVLRKPLDGWSEDDHALFQHITEQYPFDTANRHVLYMDRLKRQFPNVTQSSLVSHERWSERSEHYVDRRKAMIHDWHRDREELMNRCQVTCEHMVQQVAADKLNAERLHRQQSLCDVLRAEVVMWQERKMEAVRLKQEIEEEEQKRTQENSKREQEREQKRRAADKQKLKMYRSQLEADKQEKLEQKKKRLEELTAMLATQAEYDRERVKYREEVFVKKEEDKVQKKVDKANELAEKERRLEALRETVRPAVETDILRLWSDTSAWHNRLQDTGQPAPCHTLFDVKTFTTKQIMADPRVRFEQQVREAGLLTTEYARQALAHLPPLQPPRRDTQSTVFRK